MESGKDHKCLRCGGSVEKIERYCPSCIASLILKHPGSEDREDSTTSVSNEEPRRQKPISLGLSYDRLMKDASFTNRTTKGPNVPTLRKSAHDAHIMDYPKCASTVPALRTRDGYWVTLICLLFLALGPTGTIVIFFGVFIGSRIILGMTVVATLFAGFALSFFFSKRHPRFYWLWGLFYMLYPFTCGIAFSKSDISSTLILKAIWIGFSVLMYLSTLAGGRTAIGKRRAF
jgi:hypothetical protein